MRTIQARMVSRPQARSDGAGLAHDMWLRYVKVDDSIGLQHKTIVIPAAVYATLLDLGRADRVALYKTLLATYWNEAPVAPTRPTLPSAITDLALVEAYIDLLEAWEAQVAALVAQSETLATQGGNWIESLAPFTSWPFDFVLQ